MLLKEVCYAHQGPDLLNGKFAKVLYIQYTHTLMSQNIMTSHRWSKYWW